MHRTTLERRLSAAHDQLVRARAELAILDEQVVVMTEAAEDARLRSLVSETPLAAREYSEARRHADVAVKARQSVVDSLADLQRRQDELLMNVGNGSR